MRDDDDFERWVADEGPEAVAAMVANARRQVEDESIPGSRIRPGSLRT